MDINVANVSLWKTSVKRTDITPPYATILGDVPDVLLLPSPSYQHRYLIRSKGLTTKFQAVELPPSSLSER
jgi:hypothetical protein